MLVHRHSTVDPYQHSRIVSGKGSPQPVPSCMGNNRLGAYCLKEKKDKDMGSLALKVPGSESVPWNTLSREIVLGRDIV